MYFTTTLFLLFAACGTTEVVAPPPPLPLTPAQLPLDAPKGLKNAIGKPVSIEARDLVLRVEGAEVHVPYLSGHLIPVKGGQLVNLEQPRSFEVTIDALEVRIPGQTLQLAIATGPVGKAPIRDLKVDTEGDSVLLSGHTGWMNLPFSFKANPLVTRNGDLGLELEKVRILGIGVKGFLGIFQDLIEKNANKKGHLIEIDENWLVINPFPFYGPPRIRANFSSVIVRNHAIVARLGEMSPREEGKQAGGLVLKGGAMRAQKTVFFDMTLRLVAQDGGALILDPDSLSDQIAGGVVKNSKAGDVTVYVLASGQAAVKAIVVPPEGPEEAKTPAEPARAGELSARPGDMPVVPR